MSVTKPRSPGWVPNQHGAWAMLVAPYAVGLAAAIEAGRFRVADVALFAVWITGYLAFYATSLWLKSRRKPRYRRPALTYVLGTAALGALTLALDPAVWSWLIPFAPVLLLGLQLARRRDDRSVAAGAATVAAASLMPAVVYADGFFAFVADLAAPDHRRIALVCVVCFGYFFGTVLYVKTMIRERGEPGYVVASVGWHLACGAAALWLLADGAVVPATVSWLLLAFFCLMTLRAVLMPLLWPMRGRTLRPGLLGVGELVATVALVGILVGAVTAGHVA